MPLACANGVGTIVCADQESGRQRLLLATGSCASQPILASDVMKAIRDYLKWFFNIGQKERNGYIVVKLGEDNRYQVLHLGCEHNGVDFSECGWLTLPFFYPIDEMEVVVAMVNMVDKNGPYPHTEVLQI